MLKTNINISMILCFAVQSIVSFTLSDPRYSYDVPLVHDIDVVSLETVLDLNKSHIRYQEFMPAQEVCFEPLPFAAKEIQLYQPFHVTLDKTWVLTIPHGRACSRAGYVLIDNKYILRELLCHCGWLVHQLYTLNEDKASFANVRKVSGRVAVITRLGSENYSHFLVDILGRIAILDMMGVEYDWLYIPYNKPHIKQILEAWGIDPLKIIEPSGDFHSIEADELIVPSQTAHLKPTPGITYTNLVDLCAQYWPTWLINHYRSKFLPLVDQPSKNPDRFSKRVFISRKDSYWRILMNEDEVFQQFEPYGFKRYLLSELSFLEQVELFNNAEIIVGAHGAGICNILFCSSDTTVVEIFQERSDPCFTFLAQSLKLNYIPVKTVDFRINDRASCRPTVASLDIIQNIIKTLKL